MLSKCSKRVNYGMADVDTHEGHAFEAGTHEC